MICAYAKLPATRSWGLTRVLVGAWAYWLHGGYVLKVRPRKIAMSRSKILECSKLKYPLSVQFCMQKKFGQLIKLASSPILAAVNTLSSSVVRVRGLKRHCERAQNRNPFPHLNQLVKTTPSFGQISADIKYPRFKSLD